jgi:glucokinase
LASTDPDPVPDDVPGQLEAAFDRAGRALAAGFVTTVAACDLDLVVIGGGLARTGELLLTPVRRWLTRLGGLGFVTDVTVTLAALNDHAGLVGAAALLHRPHRYATSRSTPD